MIAGQRVMGDETPYAGGVTWKQVEEFYRQIEDLPPPMERISLHPDELQLFVDRFPRVERPSSELLNPVTLFGVPIVTDSEVPLGVVRVRRGGEDTDYPLGTWPNG